MTRYGPGTSSGKRWTDEEDDELRRAAPSMSFTMMSRILPGRSAKAVRARMIILGLYAATSRSPGYTIMECVRILGVSVGAVREWIECGKLYHVRVRSLKVQVGRGGRIVVPEEALDDFITKYPFVFSLTAFPEGKHKGTLIMARPQDWVNTAQAARMLGYRDPRSVGDLARAGKLAFRRFGSPMFFRRSEIERFRHDRARRLMLDGGYASRWAHRKDRAS